MVNATSGICLSKKTNPPCHIHRAIAKDDLENFESRRIESFETKEDGLLAEIKWISEFLTVTGATTKPMDATEIHIHGLPNKRSSINTHQKIIRNF
jgi:hypothetical protein